VGFLVQQREAEITPQQPDEDHQHAKASVKKRTDMEIGWFAKQWRKRCHVLPPAENIRSDASLMSSRQRHSAPAARILGS